MDCDPITRTSWSVLSCFNLCLIFGQDFTRRWESKYHEIWEINKQKFIERYANSNPPLSKFDADIARYAEVINSVQRDDTITPINFVMLDASSLKFSIVEHCNEWQSRFTSLLYEMSCIKLKVCLLL
jgi:dynein heavy chain